LEPFWFRSRRAGIRFLLYLVEPAGSGRSDLDGRFAGASNSRTGGHPNAPLASAPFEAGVSGSMGGAIRSCQNRPTMADYQQERYDQLKAAWNDGAQKMRDNLEKCSRARTKATMEMRKKANGKDFLNQQGKVRGSRKLYILSETGHYQPDEEVAECSVELRLTRNQVARRERTKVNLIRRRCIPEHSHESVTMRDTGRRALIRPCQAFPPFILSPQQKETRLTVRFLWTHRLHRRTASAFNPRNQTTLSFFRRRIWHGRYLSLRSIGGT